MKLFKPNLTETNWVECEKRHGFDLNKNPQGCPLCEIAKKIKPEEKKVNVLTDLLSKPIRINHTEKGNFQLNNVTKNIGSHPWFNTFFSGKATGRVLANLTNSKPDGKVSLEELLAACRTAFVAADLTQYRGFPKNVDEPSSMGRLAVHFIQAFSDLGLFAFKSGSNVIPNLPSRGWNKICVFLTPAGAEFVILPNKLFDSQESGQQLTDEERTWLLAYLKKASEKGFGEYKTLKDLASFLAKKPVVSKEIPEWFLSYDRFKHILGESKGKNPGRARNIAATLSGSKLALLRELGVVSNKRNDYKTLLSLDK